MIVGVIGAGTMGSGIAQAFAQTEGFEVRLCDVKAEWAANGKAKIAKGFEKRIAKGKMDQAAADAILSKITTGTNEIVADCDLVVEAALEKIDLKKDIFKSLQGICKPDCIFATNTSSLSITEISNGLDRAVVGMHFFNPAPVMKLIEVIAGETTDPAVVEKIVEISKQIGKTPVQVKEAAGFVVSPSASTPTVLPAWKALIPPCSSAPTIRWARSLWAISLALTLSSPSWKFCRLRPAIPSIVRIRCSERWSVPVSWAARRA